MSLRKRIEVLEDRANYYVYIDGDVRDTPAKQVEALKEMIAKVKNYLFSLAEELGYKIVHENNGFKKIEEVEDLKDTGQVNLRVELTKLYNIAVDQSDIVEALSLLEKINDLKV